MRFHYVLALLVVCLTVFTGCGEDTEEAVVVVENGDVYGTVINKETGDPVKDATVDIGGKAALTDQDGKYIVKGIPFSDKLDIVVTAANYREYKDVLSLHQKLLSFSINLVPVDSPSARILETLEAFSKEVEALDPSKIPSIQSYLSTDYAAANDEATLFGIVAGVVPPNYNALPDTILTIIGKYDKLKFKFADPGVEFKGESASVQMRFEVYAETKPKPPDPPKKWEIVVNGKLNLRKQNGDWKITYWQLIPPFLKFKQEPLEL